MVYPPNGWQGQVSGGGVGYDNPPVIFGKQEGLPGGVGYYHTQKWCVFLISSEWVVCIILIQGVPMPHSPLSQLTLSGGWGAVLKALKVS